MSKSRMLNQKMAGAAKLSTPAAVALEGVPRWAREGGGGRQGQKERVDAAVPGSAPNRRPCSLSRLQPHPVMPRMPAKEQGERPPEMGAAAQPKGGTGDREGKKAHLGPVCDATAPALMGAALRRVASCLCVDFLCDRVGYV